MADKDPNDQPMQPQETEQKKQEQIPVENIELCVLNPNHFKVGGIDKLLEYTRYPYGCINEVNSPFGDTLRQYVVPSENHQPKVFDFVLTCTNRFGLVLDKDFLQPNTRTQKEENSVYCCDSLKGDTDTAMKHTGKKGNYHKNYSTPVLRILTFAVIQDTPSEKRSQIISSFDVRTDVPLWKRYCTLDEYNVPLRFTSRIPTENIQNYFPAKVLERVYEYAQTHGSTEKGVPPWATSNLLEQRSYSVKRERSPSIVEETGRKEEEQQKDTFSHVRDAKKVKTHHNHI